MLRLIEQFLKSWTELARRGGAGVLLAVLLAAAGAGYYAAGHLKVNTDTSTMLSPALPFQQRAAALRDAFPQIKEDIIVIVRAPTLDEADGYASALYERILANEDAFAGAFAPAQDPFFRENGLLYLSETELESRLGQMTRASALIETLIKSPDIGTLFSTLAENDALAERSELGAETLQKIYAELADVIEASVAGETRPFSWMGALDADLAETEVHTRLIYARPVLDFSRLQPAKAGIVALRAEIAALEAQFGDRIETYITGDPALRVEELEAVTTGIGRSMLLSLLMVTVLLFVCYRSAPLAIITLTSLIVTLTLTTGFAAAFVGELNLVSIAFTVLLVGLGLDFAIHLLLHIQERRAANQTDKDALRGAIHEVGPALALAAPTTALAFLSFVPTRFDGIAQLGVIAGAGVIIALLVSITFLPASLCLLRGAPKPRRAGTVRKFFHRLQGMSGPVAAATIIAGIFALLLMPQVRFDADQMSLRSPNAPSVIGFNLLFDDSETAPYRLSRLVASEDEAAASQDAAKALPLVASTRSLLDFVPENQDEKLELIDFANGTLVFAFDAEAGSGPQGNAEDGANKLLTRLRAAYEDGAGARLARVMDGLSSDQLNAAQQNIFAFWPQLVEQLRSQFNADYIDFESLPRGLTSRFRSADGQWRVDIIPEADARDPQALKEFVDQVEAVFPDLAGGAYQSQKAGETISLAMLEATSIALGIIAIFLWALVRRISIVLLILFPLALAAVLTAATGVVLDIPFNYANVIVLPLLIGIGVDSGIHLVMRHDQVEAGEGVFGTSTPRAILFSALTTVASFGSLMLSPHRGTASMGELLTIAISFTLICTLVVLPAVFRYQEERAASRVDKS